MSRKVGYPAGMPRKPKGTTGNVTIWVSEDIRSWLNGLRKGKQTVNDVLMEIKKENMNKLEKIEKILSGIDKDEIESHDGFWETSTGVERGKKMLEDIRVLFREWLRPRTTSPRHHAKHGRRGVRNGNT